MSVNSQVSNKNDEFRKVLWIPSQVIQKHLDQAVVPYCQSSNQSSAEQLMKSLKLFYRSLVPEEAIQSQGDDNMTTDSDAFLISLPPGVLNLGATCYLNSQLQCLSLNPAFREGVISWQKPVVRPNSSTAVNTNNTNDIMMRLQKLLVMMHRGSYSILSAEKLALSLGIQNDEMQDPTEFTTVLFDLLNEIFQESNSLKNLLPSIFQGSLEYVTECQNCRTRSFRNEAFMQLSLPIIKGYKTNGDTCSTDVKSCLDSYLSTKEFLIGDNQYYCEPCQCKCDATRETNLRELPPVLNLHLERYKFDLKTGRKRKTKDQVRLPNVITIPMNSNVAECSDNNALGQLNNNNRRQMNTNAGSSNSFNNTDSILAQKEYILCAIVSTLAHFLNRIIRNVLYVLNINVSVHASLLLS